MWYLGLISKDEENLNNIDILDWVLCGLIDVILLTKIEVMVLFVF